MFRIVWKIKVKVWKEGHDVVQVYTEVKVKIGYALRERMMWGGKMVIEIYKKKNPLLNFNSRFLPLRRLVLTSFKDGDVLYPSKSNCCPKLAFLALRVCC